MRTIAIDFDGVIHKYSKGWHDKTCYDVPVEGCFTAIQSLFEAGYSVFIFSTRSPKQIKKWMKENTYETDYEHNGMGADPGDYRYPKFGFTVETIPFWKKFWNKKNVVGITKRKLPAMAYIDDRAIKFEGNWYEALAEVFHFKTYQQNKDWLNGTV